MNNHGQVYGQTGEEKYVSRFMNGTKHWSKPDLKNKVQGILQITWLGKFTSHSLEQLQQLEVGMGAIL